MNRHECLHNHSKKMTESHDFDYWTSQKCGFGCGYSQGDMIDELEKELQNLKAELEATREQLEIAEKVIEFYGSDINWKETERDSYEYGTAIIVHSDYTVENCSWSGGKRARQYFKQKDDGK